MIRDMNERKLKALIGKEVKAALREHGKSQNKLMRRQPRPATKADVVNLKEGIDLSIEELRAYSAGKDTGIKMGVVIGLATSVAGGLLLWLFQSIVQ